MWLEIPPTRALLGVGSFLFGVGIFGSAPAGAQLVNNPRVTGLEFPGAESIRESTLRNTVWTEETHCRTILVQPFCWVTDWELFVERRYLDEDELPADELRLRVLYWRRGFRETRVESEVRPNGDGVDVLFHVEEGPPTVLDTVTVRQTEEILSDRQLRGVRIPAPGDPLDLFRLDTLRAELQEMLGNEGYLDARVHDSVRVGGDGRGAELSITLEPGPRSTLGEFVIIGNRRVDDRTIRNATYLSEGDVVRRDAVREARRSLYESNLFHRADVSVPSQPDSAKRLEIRVQEAAPRQAVLGGGFNTVEFVQVEGRFVHFNWLGGGRRLDNRLVVGNLLAPQLNDRGIFHDLLPGALTRREERAFLRPTWEASVDFVQPAFRAAENSAGLGVFAQRRVVPGVLIEDGYGAHGSVTRRLGSGVSGSATYRFELTGIEAGDLYFCVNHGICDPETISLLARRQRLSPIGVNFVSEQQDDALEPTRGWRGRMEAEHASSFTLSDFQYNRVSGALAGYLPFGGARHVLAGRIRVGWVRAFGDGLEQSLEPGDGDPALHPRKRFFAGGARSVRGYAENQLGPRVLTVEPDTLLAYDPACAAADLRTCDPGGVPVEYFWPRPLGGRAVAEASLEYRFPIWEQLRGAVFLDAAGVRGPGEGLLGRGVAALTPGFGVRYSSPVGPIRVDLGIRPTLAETLPVFTETLDDVGERRLVQLDQARRFDPLEEAEGAVLRQVLQRLILHLSIGQAF